jgi:hypothetical protein
MGKLVRKKPHWKDLDIGRKIILKWILEYYDGVVIWNTEGTLWSADEEVNH